MLGVLAIQASQSADALERVCENLGLGESLLSCRFAGRVVSAHRHLKSDLLWLVAIDGSHVVALVGSEPATLRAGGVRLVAGQLPPGAVAVGGAIDAAVSTTAERNVWLACIAEGDVELVFRDKDRRVVGRELIGKSIERSVISRAAAALRRRLTRLPRGSADI